MEKKKAVPDYRIIERDDHGRSRVQCATAIVDGKKTPVSFNRKYGSHEFSTEEIETLLVGDAVTIKDFEKKSGKKADITGKLGWQEFMGHRTVSFTRIDKEAVMNRMASKFATETEQRSYELD